MIAVIDYGMGNLRSVSKAFERFGAEVIVCSDPKALRKADKMVLPGVGAFGDAVRELSRLGLTEVIKEHIAGGKPFLGICLGLQLLFDESEESQGVKGLGIISGRVMRLTAKNVKIPHMGWNRVKIHRDHTMLKGVPDGSYFYFVHSFHGVPSDAELVAGSTEYGGEKITAAVALNNIFAVQFHPEKSQEMGLAILKNFIGLKML